MNNSLDIRHLKTDFTFQDLIDAYDVFDKKIGSPRKNILITQEQHDLPAFATVFGPLERWRSIPFKVVL